MKRRIFKRFGPDTPVRRVANIKEQNFWRNVLNDIQGIGCRVEIPENQGGLGARVIVDGGADIDWPDPEQDPFRKAGNKMFFASIANVNGEWIATEQIQDANGFSDKPAVDGGREVAAEEANGYSAADLDGNYQFYSLVKESDDGEYAFEYPIPESAADDQGRQLLINSDGLPDWSNVYPAFGVTVTGDTTVDVDAGDVYFLNQIVQFSGANNVTVAYPSCIVLEVSVDSDNVITGSTLNVPAGSKPDFWDGTKYNFVIAQLFSGGNVKQCILGDVYAQAAPFSETDDYKSILRVNSDGVPYWGLPSTFVAEITGSSTWTANELIQSSGGFSNASTRQGITVVERNGLTTGSTETFRAEVTETLDSSGNPFYSFTLPIFELGNAYQLLRTNSAGTGWEWGCAEIT